ncbi:MAG: hypothetical protein DDT40_00445 [candidate division WS2 bacterium]|uniref:Uncharacterized protein n=1 Tax=Psychracetigena formicireducens TaxID=2986056 RepID=A0A9E2BF14_PSYF1|nr:hypothetical protein [Candidatus Psychracetigena formicireducens]MBT9144398.1 hypothetical protein [Candidatus Psychracetigena formicireducens]MBT9150277.1 hypothetical protein [Candidatus Psychracetigena formicireducens]
MEGNRIIVFVDDRELPLYRGMEVKHALIAYDMNIYQEAMEGKLKVVDEWGNEVGLSGAISEGNRFYIKGR